MERALGIGLLEREACFEGLTGCLEIAEGGEGLARSGQCLRLLWLDLERGREEAGRHLDSPECSRRLPADERHGQALRRFQRGVARFSRT